MRSDPRPSWQAIRDEALRRIRARDWPPGERIPDEAALAAEFGCARTTVNRALRALAEAGFIERRRKGGSRVKLTPLRKATLEIPVIRQEVEASGGIYGYRLLSRREAEAPAPILRTMGLPAGTMLLHVCSLHLRDGVPHVHEDRWLNPGAVTDLMALDLAQISANEWLVRNVPYTRGTLALSASAASSDVAAALGCASGDALFTMQRLTWQGETPVTHVTQSYAPGHSLRTDI